MLHPHRRAVPRERAATFDALRARITLIWHTAAAREAQPSVLDEVESFLNDPASWSAKHGGISAFGRGQTPDGQKMVAINMRCIDDLDMAEVQKANFNGAAL